MIFDKIAQQSCGFFLLQHYNPFNYI